MKLRKDIVGIILSFSLVGAVATGVDAASYKGVMERQSKQEIQIQKKIASEFVSKDDQQRLEQDLIEIKDNKNKKTRRQLDEMMSKEDSFLVEVDERIEKKETEVAQNEQTKLASQFKKLEEESQEKYIVETDLIKVKDLDNEFKELQTPKKVKPVRSLATKIENLSEQMKGNQTVLTGLVNDLKKENSVSEKLEKNRFVSEQDKKMLATKQTENKKFFDNANNIETVKECKEASQAFNKEVETKKSEIEKDFTASEEKAKKLVTSSDKLLLEGNLEADEKKKLEDQSKKTKDALALTKYESGDLTKYYGEHQETYDDLSKKSEDRKKETERKAKEDEKKREVTEVETIKDDSEVISDNEQAGGVIPTGGGWNRPPDGYVFLKVDSGLTYRQVKNPTHYLIISEADGQKFEPGHGNGSAKQR